MATTTFTAGGLFSNDADFRAWANAVSSGLAAVGLVKQTFTGQIDLSTVAKPSVAGTIAGWEIWSLPSATQPCYIKVGYGVSTVGNNVPRLQLAVGTAFNASNGAFIGSSHVWDQMNPQTSFASKSYRFSCNGSGFSGTFAESLNTGYYNWNIAAIEQTRNGSGALDGRGMIVARIGTDPFGSNMSAFIPRNAATIWSASMGVSVNMPPSGTGADGADFNLFPIRVMSKQELPPFVMIASYFEPDFSAMNPISVASWQGGSHTYLPISSANGGSARVPYATLAYTPAVALLWE